MNRDAHYYAILAFCRACGFTKDSAYQVAYASQFVDDAVINHITVNGPIPVDCDEVDNIPCFFNMATCHSYFKMKTFNYEAMVGNTAAFHFVPGCKGENFTRKLRCNEESPVIKDLLTDTLGDSDLIKLGIVLHAYADTFSHQGFSGILSKVNDIRDCKTETKFPLGIIDQIIKFFRWLDRDKYERMLDSVFAYGHAQAMEYPDIPYLTWEYKYDFSDEFKGLYKSSDPIDNKARYTRAFQEIKKHLESYLRNHPEYADKNVKFENFDILFKTLVTKDTERNREINWQKLLVQQGLFHETDSEFLIYDNEKWLQEAFADFDPAKFHERKVEQVRLLQTFPISKWFRFYQAVKWYKERFYSCCSKYGLDIPG